MIEHFLGRWSVDATKSHYEFGEPIVSGGLDISMDDNFTVFDFYHSDTGDKHKHFIFEQIADGITRPYGDSDVEESVLKVNDNKVEAVILKNDEVICAFEIEKSDKQLVLYFGMRIGGKDLRTNTHYLVKS
ncbi:hypothetical protein [Paraferrimonas haliotis]|uniref:Uncharacterized protein n=1 Tax=Paraferrimonas haliotis TaxID=2013866 RepID=A0AA37WXN8_9GAMM|nr:hypothetical protein [Paraferrimonas haliotis]GLS84587.1 hypothetical protein GCM10007894_25640 [Paraferrimonas haliotis]